MTNEAHVSLIGFVATQPKKGQTKKGTLTLSMRVGWTPRSLNTETGEWSDQESSFLTVYCYRKVAEHASVCLRKGEPVVVRGTLRVREYDDKTGQRRIAVDVQADSIGHDMSRGISNYRKLSARAELTAEEYERTQAATIGRSPLPDDLARAEAEGAPEADEDSEQVTDDLEVASGDATELELAAEEDEESDESADNVPASDYGELEPVGALA